MRFLIFCAGFNDELLCLVLIYRFLIEGNKGAILHTGDFRAEPCFLDAISRNPYLRRYLAQPPITQEHLVQPEFSAQKTLEVIYLDTASLLSKLDAPSKVCSDLIASSSANVLLIFDPETGYLGSDRINDPVPANGILFYQHVDVGLRRHPQSHIDCI